MSTHSDYRELLTRIRNSDKAGLEELFRKLYSRLRNYANVIINSRQDAEDVVQEVFVKLWMNRHELDESKSIETFLFVCTRNSCLNWLKHKRTESAYARIMELVYTRQNSASTPHELLIADDIENAFYQALDDLPVECRKIFELSRFQGLKYQEIATQLNISIKTVETQMSRALVKIRFQLKRYTAILSFVLAIGAIS